MSKLLLVSRCAWSLYNYRRGHIKSLQNEGDLVIGAGAEDKYASQLRDLGVPFVGLPIPFKSINPLADLRLLLSFYRLYRKEKPEVVHHFTIKPVIYGSIAARLAGVPRIVNTVTGLGFVFTDQARPWLRRIVEAEYKLALSCAHFTFFQNDDDRQLFLSKGLIASGKTGLLPGSGVDTNYFTPRNPEETASEESGLVFLMVARMLRDKGVYEFVEAARMLSQTYPGTRFWLLGKRDEHNPMVVPGEELENWKSEGIVQWLGEVTDVRDVVGQADVVVLPSYYREGTPRALLEAAAMAKPLITTDNVGCRETVDHEVNGLMVPIKDARALADAMRHMIENPELRKRMGTAGREKMVREFDEKIVLQRVSEVYKNGRLNVPPPPQSFRGPEDRPVSTHPVPEK